MLLIIIVHVFEEARPSFVFISIWLHGSDDGKEFA